MITEEDIPDPTKTVTRAQFARFLSYNGKYEVQIDDLINWDSGY